MLKTILFFGVLVFSLSIASAQDIIVLKSGLELKVHIVNLNSKNIMYTTEKQSDTLLAPRNEINILRYKSGITIYLSDEAESLINYPSDTLSTDSLFLLGEKDAFTFYKGYKPAATGTLFTSFFVPWGLIPAIACSAKPPDRQNLGFMNPKFKNNSSYNAGFTHKAFEIKKKKVWTNFAIGTGSSLAFMLFIATLSTMLYL